MPDQQTCKSRQLRQHAEEVVRREEEINLQALSDAEVRGMFHELRVHQIELEMQNEELLRTQHELETSRSRYFELYDLAPIGYLTLNAEGLIEDANLAVATLLGLERKDLLKKPLSRFIFPDDQDLYYLHRKQLFAAHEVQTWEMRLKRGDDKFFWASLRATPAEGGEYWITLVDITNRQQTENALIRSEESLHRQNALFLTLLKNLPTGIFMVEVPSGRPLVANDAALKLLGRGILPDASVENLSEVYQAFKMGSREPYPPEEMPILLGMKGLSSHVDDMMVVRPDGTEVLLEVFGSPMTDEEGRIWASLVSFSDISERKEAENRLRNTTELLTLFINNSPIYAYIKEVTEDGSRVLHASENFQEMIGIPGSKMVNKTMPELFPAEMAAKITADDQTVVAGGVVLNLEEELAGRHYQTIKFPIHQGDRTLLAGYTIDMTERKQAEKVLRARLKISEYTLQHSLQELLTKVADEAEALTDSQIAFFHFIDADQVTLTLKTWSSQTLASLCRAQESGGHSHLEGAGVWADSIRERRPLIQNDYAALPGRKGLPPGHPPIQREVVVPIFRNKQIVGVLGVGNKATDYTQQDVIFLQHLANLSWDIVIRKQAEEALRSSEIKYSRLFGSMTDAYVCVDMEGRIVDANSSYQELTGYGLEELALLTYVQLTPEKWRAREAEIVEEQVLPRGYSDLYEKEYQRKDGSIINIELKTFLLRDDTGEPAEMWAIIRDITERKVAEEELRQAKVAAEAANIAKSQFLANMSHEIRTPMNGVIGLIELLLGTELTKEQRQYAKLVKASGKNLVELISNILDLSKIEAHKIELETVNFNLSSEMSDTINLFLLSAQEKGLELSTQIDPDVPLLLNGDPGRLRQILTNLISNAIKFTENGSISLLVRKDADDTDAVTLRFLIRDTGIGIAPEKLEQIFEPFIQADGSTTRKYGGTGLGLAIARQLAALMGGTVGVESNVAEGTTFWFTAVLSKLPERRTIPRTETIACEQVETVLPKTAIATEIRILLAEDDFTNQLMTKALLTKFGYQVDVAKNGYETLRLLEENDYAVVLMDCMMPELNGYETTAIIRDPTSAVRNHAIPVIALTANALQEDRDSCLAAGMNDYLPKPINVINVMALLEKWIPVNFTQEPTD